ncbi:MAG: hypothetical protein ACE5RN_03440 [Nitrosopumilaceae archaeon]
MRKSKKTFLIILFLSIGVFGYSQYTAASNIGVIVTENEFIEKTETASIYNVQLEFQNPSLLVLNAGETDFIITVEDTKIADGVLEPFILSSMSKASVNGKYLKDDQTKISENQSPNVKISGITKYDVFFTSLEIPFIYFPSDDQAREFIHQN